MINYMMIALLAFAAGVIAMDIARDNECYRGLEQRHPVILERAQWHRGR